MNVFFGLLLGIVSRPLLDMLWVEIQKERAEANRQRAIWAAYRRDRAVRIDQEARRHRMAE